MVFSRWHNETKAARLLGSYFYAFGPFLYYIPTNYNYIVKRSIPLCLFRGSRYIANSHLKIIFQFYLLYVCKSMWVLGNFVDELCFIGVLGFLGKKIWEEKNCGGICREVVNLWLIEQTKLENMLRQENGYGCGMYAVANATNRPDFVTPDRLEQSKGGNNMGQLAKWMQDDGFPFYIDVLYYDHLGQKLPQSALGYHPMGESVMLLPVLIEVQLSDGGKSHMVAGKITKDGVLHLYDSLKSEVIETTLAGVNEMYHRVHGLFVFAGIETGDYAFI